MARIHDAIEEGDIDAVAKMIASDPSSVDSPDALSNRPMHVAVYSGQLEILKMLLNAGANVNCRGDMQRTPLHYAAIESRKRGHSTFSDQDSPHFTSPVPFSHLPLLAIAPQCNGPPCQCKSYAQDEVHAYHPIVAFRLTRHRKVGQ
jgi:hypothetical protein